MFFSVKHTMKIGGKVFQPCICYPVIKDLTLTVEKLKKEGKAETYDKEVFFQNGKKLPSVEERKAPVEKAKEPKVEEKQSTVEDEKEKDKKGF